MTTSLADQLDGWVASGLITADQAGRIREHEAQQPAVERGHRGSLVIEGLGYVGLVLVVIAAVTIAGRYWSDFGAVGRLALVLGAAVVLVAAGGAVTAAPGSAGHRLRAVAWMLGVVAFGGGLALFADEVLALQGERVALAAGLGAGVLAAILWWRHHTVLQEAAVVASGAWVAGAAAASLPSDETGVVGLALWGWGTVWLLLGSARAGIGRATADVCGGAVAVLGALLAVYTDAGSVLALVTAAILVVVGVTARDLVLLGVGSVATLATVPVVMARWFPDTLVAPIALLVTGVVLVTGAVLVARRRRAGPRTGPTGSWSPGIVPAAGAAVLTGLAVATAVVVLGLG